MYIHYFIPLIRIEITTFWHSIDCLISQNMLRKNTQLPTHEINNKSVNNGVTVNSTNFSVLATVLWGVFCLTLVIYGIYNCSSNSANNRLSCDDIECHLMLKNSTGSQDFRFSRIDLLSGELVRIAPDGHVVNIAEMHKRGVDSHERGYTVELKVRYVPPESDKKETRLILLSNFHITRNVARKAEKQLKEYKARITHKLELSASKWWTQTGLISIVFGVMGLYFGIIFGVWSDPAPKKIKKSY